MKLHLPKALLTAVLAAVTLGYPAQALTGWGPNNFGQPGDFYYIATKDEQSIDTTTRNENSSFSIVADVANLEATASVKAKNGITLTVCQNPWPDDYHVFNSLKLTKIEIADNGAIDLVIRDNAPVNIQQVVGCLSSVTNAGNLTLGTAANEETGTDASVINLSGAIVNTGSLTLNGTFTFDVSSISNYTRVEGSGSTKVDANENGNGFLKFVGASYYLVNNTNGTQLTASTATFATSNGSQTQTLTDGSVVAICDEVTTIYSIVSGSETYGGDSTTINLNATEIQVSKGAELILASDFEWNKIKGEGNVTLKTNVTGMTADAQATGKLTLDGVTLNIDVGRDTNNNRLATFTSIDLKDAVINYHGSNTTLMNVKVDTGASTFNIRDMGTDRVVTMDGTTTLLGDLTIKSEGFGNDPNNSWKYKVNIAALDGSGDLTIESSKTQAASSVVTAHLLDSYRGTINVQQNKSTAKLIATAAGDINLEGLNIKGGATVDLSGVTGTKNLGLVTTDASSSLTLQGTVGNMQANAGSSIILSEGTTFVGNATFSCNVRVTGSLSNTGTLNFSKGYSSIGTLTNEGIFNLSGNVTISDMGQLEDSGVVTYSHNDGKDGYITGATYFVVESTGEGAYATVTSDSKLMLGSSEIGSITSSGYNLVVDIHNENANSGIYYINTQDVTVDGTETNVAVNATGYVIAKDRTLTLKKNQNTTTMTASNILAEATGEGNITVDVDFTYQGQSKATGTLTINQGKTLKVGTGSNGTSNISSFNAVVLKGATLDLNGSAQEVQNLMVDTAKSTLSIRNKEKGHQIYTLSGTTTLKADLDVIPMENEHGDLVVKNLTGVGNLHASGGNAGWGPVVMKLEKLTNYTGSVSVDSLGRTTDINHVEFGKADTDAAFSTLKGLSLSNNAYATIYAKGDSTIENLTLTNGAKLNYITNYSANEYTLSKVVVSGEGNFINFAADDKYYQGFLEINNLTNARTEDGEAIAGAITISGNARTTDRDVVNLNGGDFVGTITYKGTTNDGTNRKHALNIKSATAAANAVINLEALSDGDVVALGLGDDTVNVKGITGSKATIYSGEQEYGNGNDFASDTQKSRTLAINTAGVSYENSVAVSANVNLEKRGAGKQTFSGNMSAFNGSLKVMEGELAFTAAEALKVNGLYVGPEKNAAAPAASEGANVGILTVANGIEASGAVTLAGGATINGSIDMSAATEVCFDVTVGSAPIQLNGSLTMSTTEAFVSALDLSSMTAGQMLTVFTGLESFTIGNVKSAEFTSADLSTWSSTGAVASGQYTVEYQVDNNVGSIVVISHMDVVPEPTTATLSLLALAGLCARRRRRA